MSLSNLFRNMPIRRKLTVITILSAGVALLFVALVSIFHQWFLLHSELEEATHSQASIVGTNTTLALISNDPKSASQTLEALEHFSNIEFATLYDRQGKVFAQFLPNGRKPPPPYYPPIQEQHVFTSTHLDVFHPIFFEDERVGTLQVRSSLETIYRQMAWSVALLVAAALGGMGLATILINYAHPAITEPMGRLLGLMEAVSREKNYTLRAEIHGKDELGALAQGLNDMLGQIQIRDDALAQHRQDLEGEVVQRTAELEKANLLLGEELAERREADRELQAANEQLSILLDSLPIAVYRCRAEGDYAVTYMSHNVVAFTGYAPRHFIEESDLWIKRIHPDDAPRIAAEMPILYEKGMHAYEYRWQHADGNYRWILDSLRLIRPENGTANYLVGMWQDITERKLAEEKISKQQELTSQIIETIPMRVFWKDRELRYQGCNTLFAKDAGLSRPDELIGKSDFDMSWKDQAEMYRADDRLVMDTNTPKISYDEPQTTPDGGEIWLRSSKVPLVNEVDESIGVLGVYEDITARKLAAQALEESERKFRTILDSAVDGILVADGLTHKFVTANRAICNMLGYQRDELYQLGLEDIHPQDALPEVQRQFERQMNGEIQGQHDLPVMRKDGSVFFADISTSPLLLAGRPCLVGIFHDVTERKRAETELRLFRTLLDNSSEAVEVLDPANLRFLDVNQKECADLGYSREELLTMGVVDIDPFFGPDATRLIQEQLRNTGAARFEAIHRRRDGSTFPVEVSSRLIELDRPYLLNIVRDITERKQVEEEIRRLNEELEEKVKERTQQLLVAQEDLVRKEKLAVLGQVAGSVGHELRNPLGVMNNAVYFLQTVLSEADDTVKEYLGMIKTEIAAADRIVSDLLDSVRTKPPQPEVVGVGDLINQILRKLAVPASVAVQLEIPATLPSLQVDPLQVQQVFRNLISNGIDAMAEGGTLEIRATTADEGKAITVSIRDTGCGIPPEQVARLFQPLYTTKARGIGLGLVVVKNLTEANGGRIEVESEQGRGTVFSITLPCVSSPVEEA
ncbi:hypothetical protein SKTS_23450 [Sulfurimicrobium lacus]|uniref:histidine kinase n=1 Tax=Sulfurimicrobium lacus TaxID=2715678 RepID=A0A6F8VFG1_9PROT|nr:PAS domain S-box protein [Sulfurimicrobium lacus]BCB27459.1 hypothetical protein SKTS_23450 [Sulfurimicrobium lacus]